jgi:rubrerythrin
MKIKRFNELNEGVDPVFSVLKNDRKLTNEELIRAIRLMISAEYDAVKMYMQLAESIDNKLA